MMKSKVMEETVEVIDESFENTILIPFVEYKNAVKEVRYIDFDEVIIEPDRTILDRIWILMLYTGKQILVYN
jgi:hypothetical protein